MGKEVEHTVTTTYVLRGERYRIVPASCLCGGDLAWVHVRPDGAEDMVGCVCHHLPTGQRLSHR